MLMVSVSRRSMLTRYERISSQETAVKGSSCPASEAAAVIQADHKELSRPMRWARRSSWDTVRGGKSVRVKKYGCGKSAGPESAPASLSTASGCDLNLAAARKGAAANARKGDG